MEELIKQIKLLQDDLNKDNIDVYQFYEEVIALVEYYETINK